MTLGDDHTFIVQCEFITGSDAQGCMVVLVGELDNITVNLTRNSKPTLGTLAVANPLSSYIKVLAFDMERDGSVGTVSVDGDIITMSIIIKTSGLYNAYRDLLHNSDGRSSVLWKHSFWDRKSFSIRNVYFKDKFPHFRGIVSYVHNPI